jgi:hypothetical protein
MSLRDYQAGILLYEKVLKEDPTNARARMLLEKIERE